MPRKKKIKKRANRTGSIIKLKGNRRKPYAVRVTIGRDENRRPIRKNLDYFETEQEASDFLDMYNLMRKTNDRIKLTEEQARSLDNDLFEKVKNASDSIKTMLTFEEIFKILFDKKYSKLKSFKSIESWFNNFSKIHKRSINNISLHDLQYIFDDLKKQGRKSGTLAHMKVLASDIFEYAIIHEYIKRDEDFTSYIDINLGVDKTKKKRNVISIEEIKELKKRTDDFSKYILILIYTGCRPGELINLSKDRIHLDVLCNDDGQEKIISYIITGSKTEAGRNRIVPIHDDIKDIIKSLVEKNDVLIPIKDTGIFIHNFKKILDNHIPYECRHTFSTLAKTNGVEDYARKKIMGHKSNDITDDVYTHTIYNYLFDEINKIKI